MLSNPVVMVPAATVAPGPSRNAVTRATKDARPRARHAVGPRRRGPPMHRVALAAAAIAALCLPAVAAACDPSSGAGLAACVDQERYAADLRAIAAAPRPARSAHLEATRKRCYETFGEAGFGVRRHAPATDDAPEPEWVAARLRDFGVTNVIGRLKGTDPSRPAVVIGAHMDSIDGCNGANDNASGVAAVLEMARVLGRTRPAADLYVACWDAEEIGKYGSEGWVAMARHQKRAIDMAIVFEQIGNRQTAPKSQREPPGWFVQLFPAAAKAYVDHDLKGDFVHFFHDSGARVQVWQAMKKAGGIEMFRSVVQRKPDGAVDVPIMMTLSDHISFWKAGYPAVYVTDTGPFRTSSFHCIERPDDAQYIDMAFATGVTRAATVLAADRLGIAP